MKNFLVYVPKKDQDIRFTLQPMERRKNIYMYGFITMMYQNQAYAIFVDGELYNTSNLQYNLRKNGFPNCSTIEEMILYAYILWGQKAMDFMEGAYSFTIITEDTIFCTKDPFGLRPIYYVNNRDGIWISNRIRTLLENSTIKPVLDKYGILELFSFGPSISEDKTLYQDIQSLAMGQLIRIEQKAMQVLTYYHLKARKHVDTLEETATKVHELVCESILAQQKDCSACFLSGGLDSSILASIVSTQQKCRTYSLDYEGNKDSFQENMYQVSLDSAFIDEMQRYSKCEHTYLLLQQQTLLDSLTKAMLAREAPGMADVDASLLWFCTQVAKKEKIVLSGECSDEMFGGYPWFYRDELKDLHTFPWLRSTNERISLLHADIKMFGYEKYIQQQYEKSTQTISYLEDDTKEDRRARLHTVLCLHWFMQTLVTRQVCEADMANLFIRAPFANVKLLEYVYNIPWKMKFYGDEEKGILRKAFAHELPKSIAHRKKNPFPKTHNPLYAKLISERLKERYNDSSSPLHTLFDDRTLKELINSHGKSFHLPWYGQLMSGPQLLAYMYQIDQWIINYHIEIKL